MASDYRDSPYRTMRGPQRRGREWQPLHGDHIELRRWGSMPRYGLVETVLEDSSGFWLRAEGVDGRVFVDLNDDSIQVWH